MAKFDNSSRTTNDQRAAFLERMGAKVENHGDDDDPAWKLFYVENGLERSTNLDAQSWEDAVFEACEFLND